MSISPVLFASTSDETSERAEWETPESLFRPLYKEFCFTLDAAASPANAKVKPHEDCYLDDVVEPGRPCPSCGVRVGRFFTAQDDALVQDWGKEPIWLNPPYSRRVRRWIKKCADSAAAGALVVVLLPSRTSADWWHDYIWDADLHRPRGRVEVRFLRGRIRFVGAAHDAPFPSVVVVFHPPAPADRCRLRRAP